MSAARVLLLAAALIAAPAAAQNFPSKLIRIVTASPGSLNDWRSEEHTSELQSH